MSIPYDNNCNTTGTFIYYATGTSIITPLGTSISIHAFPKALAQNEMQSAQSKIWGQVFDFISYVLVWPLGNRQSKRIFMKEPQPHNFW